MKGVLRGTEEDNSSVWKKLVVRKIFFYISQKIGTLKETVKQTDFKKTKISYKTKLICSIYSLLCSGDKSINETKPSNG